MFRRNDRGEQTLSPFEQQFYNPYATPEGASYVKILPNTQDKNITSNHYIAGIPGLGDGLRAYRSALEYLHAEGEPTLFLDRSVHGFPFSQVGLTETGPALQESLYGYLSMLQANPDAKYITGVGHSFAALVALLAAYVQDQQSEFAIGKIEDVVLISPPTGDDIPTIIRDYASKIGRDSRDRGLNGLMQPSTSLGTIRETVLYVARRPGYSIQELFDLSRFDTAGMIQSVREKGVRVHVVHPENDRIFLAEKAQDRLEGIVDSFDLLPESTHHIASIHAAGAFQRILRTVRNREVCFQS